MYLDYKVWRVVFCITGMYTKEINFLCYSQYLRGFRFTESVYLNNFKLIENKPETCLKIIPWQHLFTFHDLKWTFLCKFCEERHHLRHNAEFFHNATFVFTFCFKIHIPICIIQSLNSHRWIIVPVFVAVFQASQAGPGPAARYNSPNLWSVRLACFAFLGALNHFPPGQH
jgi:hypothetical protein